MSWGSELVGKKVVVKLGGNAMTDSALLETFAQDVAELAQSGVKLVVVHGGGPQISEALEKANIPNSFVDGLRVTPREALPIIRDVLMETISKPLSKLIEKSGIKSVPLNGITEDLLLAEITRNDLGFVGEVFAVRDSFLRELLEQNTIPVISSIALDLEGNLVNVNADLAASSIAVALQAEEVIFFTDVDGLYRDFSDKASLISSISAKQLEALAPSLDSGMIPKVEAALSAVGAGVPRARILNGSINHSLQKLANSTEALGTKIEG